MQLIQGLSPNHSRVIQNFEKITEIPRCSGEESKISTFLYEWATQKGIEVYQDKMLNIIFKKKASPGFEEHETILLQGHMDMVCEVKKGYEFDFTCQGIQAEIKGDLIVAENTTLGADNGIAVAMIMTIFEDSSLEHPPLEALITVDEERGMTGAIHLESKYIKARKLINIDSEDEGVCCVGCAGGQRDKVIIKKDILNLSEKETFYLLTIEGLQGGHSGQDIHIERGNANRLLARILIELKKDIDYNLSSFTGGSKSNAIPRDAQAIISILETDYDALKEFIDRWEKILKHEYSVTDPNLKIKWEKTTEKISVSKNSRDILLSYLLLAPNGVSTMSKKVSGQVESSTNIGVVEENSEEWIITSQVRSSLASKIQEISRRNQLAAEIVGGKFESDDSYPAWEYEEESELRNKASEVWKRLTDQELKIETIHAGLECGLLQDVIGKMDMISIGPNMAGVHAPGEYVSIDSTDRVYKYLVELLKEL